MTDARPIRILIVDDEPLARQRIADLLAHERDVDIVGTADSGNTAIDAIRRLTPDLVFLDVQMPGRSGIDVVREIGAESMPATIFVTAFDRFAVDAFNVAALDYLVKPFDDERFEQAFARARRHLELEGLESLRERLLSVLDAAPRAAEPSDATPVPEYLDRVAVESRGKVRVVPVSEIEYITQSGPYAELHVAGRVHLIREAMQTLEERLDPTVFMRVHRSAIVRTSLVDTLHKGAGGDYELQLKTGARVRVSRSRREAVEKVMGVQ